MGLFLLVFAVWCGIDETGNRFHAVGIVNIAGGIVIDRVVTGTIVVGIVIDMIGTGTIVVGTVIG